MGKHTIKDFKKDDEVYLLSNPEQVMVVINILESSNKISCRWVKDEMPYWKNLLPQDLGKVENLEK